MSLNLVKAYQITSPKKQPFANVFKTGALKNFAIFTEKSCVEVQTLSQVFSCEYCKIFKNSFFMEHLQ